MELFNITLFGEILTFVVLVLVTMKFIWPIIIKAIDARQQQIAAGLAAGERGQHDLVLAQQRSLQIIQQAERDAEESIEKAKLHANEIIEHAKSQAKIEGKNILIAAKADIENERAQVSIALQKQATLLALSIVEKLLQSKQTGLKLESLMHDQLLEQILGELKREER